MNQKTKVLFVVMDFWQAGAQRFAHEVDSALSRNKYEVSILSFRSLNASNEFADYYYKKHISLGSEVFFFDDFKMSSTISLFEKIWSGSNTKSTSINLDAFLQKFDIINWVGEYCFAQFTSMISSATYEKSIIHIMNARFQGASVYSQYPDKHAYIFASNFDDTEQVNYELSEIKKFEHIYFPLSLDTTDRINNWKYKNNSKKKIGIFTRLSTMKPLDPFIYAFHLLLDLLPETELHIFGAGDPVETGVSRFTENLGIKNIFYRGHQEDMIKTAQNEELDLVWFQGYKNRPAGYAGFDICTVGIPQVLWEFNHNEIKENNSSEVYPIFKNLNAFVEKSYSILTNKSEAVNLSNVQFNDILEKRNIYKNIGILEELFQIVETRLVKKYKNDMVPS